MGAFVSTKMTKYLTSKLKPQAKPPKVPKVKPAPTKANHHRFTRGR